MAINCSSWRQKKLHIEYIYSLGKLQGHQVGELSFSDLQEGECAGNLPFSPFPFFPLFSHLVTGTFFWHENWPLTRTLVSPSPLFFFFVDRVSSFVFPFFFPDFPIPLPTSLLLWRTDATDSFPLLLAKRGKHLRSIPGNALSLPSYSQISRLS